MKIRRSILWFCIIVIVLTVLVVWYARQPAKTSMPIAAPTEAITPAPPATNLSAPITGHAVVPIPSNTVSVPRESKEQEALEILSAQNDLPIVFYGKIEDQFGNVLVGVTVNFSVQVYNGVRSGVDRGQVISDASGLFTISGFKGERLGLVPEKSGYVFMSMNGSGVYTRLAPENERAHPDINNPVVIKMWKLQGSEPLFWINQRYKFHYTDAPMNFDLLTGTIVPVGGDIKITMNRSPGLISGRTRQDWGVQVEVVDGGLIESGGQEGVTFEAPASGYQPSDSFVISTNAPHKWFGGFDQTFFLKSRNGQVYSKVNFSISINQQPDDYVWVEFHGVANTNSSRNWEATVPQ